jgi:PAS domain S-box-containing protein
LRIVVDAETGQRGYLLTGDPDYLEPYQNAQAHLRESLNTLRQAIHDHTVQQQRLSAWQEQIEKKMGEMAVTISLYSQPETRTEAIELVRNGSGNDLMDQIRNSADDFIETQQNLFNQYDRDSHAAASLARWTLASVTAVGTVLAAAAFALIGREMATRLAFTEDRLRLLNAERQARADADEHARRFRLLAETMPQLVWAARPDGTPNYFNSGWVAHTGLSVEQSCQEWYLALHPDDFERTRECWQKCCQTGELYDIEYRLRDREGNYRWFLSRGAPLHDASGQIIQWIGTCTDIDDQKRTREQLEAMVRERTTELERSNRALQEFAVVASHDLQEPLRKIQAFGDRLSDRFGNALTDAGKDYIQRMLSASGRMRVLIDDLLAFSRVTTKARPFEQVDLNRVAQDVVGDLEIRLRQTQGRIEIAPLPSLFADPMQMRQLFQNLFANALKFHRPDQPPLVQVKAEMIHDPEPAWRITVSDNGIGFEEKYLPRIFEVFQRLHSRDEYEGTGIGLAICRKIVERHGGQITARSQPNTGSTFEIVLPIRQPETE